MSAATVAAKTVSTWLITVLTSDSQLAALAPGGVWRNVYPQQLATFPVVVFQSVREPQDVRPSGTEYVMADCLYLVKGIDKAGSWENVEAVDARLVALLDNQSGDVPPAGQVFFCQRESSIELNELAAGGAPFVHLGGRYRILAR